MHAQRNHNAFVWLVGKFETWMKKLVRLTQYARSKLRHTCYLAGLSSAPFSSLIPRTFRHRESRVVRGDVAFTIRLVGRVQWGQSNRERLYVQFRRTEVEPRRLGRHYRRGNGNSSPGRMPRPDFAIGVVET